MCDISEYWLCVLEAKGHKINLGVKTKGHLSIEVI